MRADMKKVLTERPRRGGAYAYKDFRPRKSQGEYADHLPCHEGMRRPYGYDHKTFDDLLGPLRQYLRGCVGRRWDDVWSEVCKVVNGGNTVDQHLRGHVQQEVDREVFIEDDRIMARGRYRTHAYEPDGLYVDPRDGLLHYNERPAKKPRKDKIVDGLSYHHGDDGLLYPSHYGSYHKYPSGRYPLKVVGKRRAMHIEGIWYWVISANTPPPINVGYVKDGKPLTRLVYFPRLDIVTGAYVKEGRYYAERRQMASRDLRQNGLLNTRGN